MAKEFKSANELIKILNSKGVSIKDENSLLKILKSEIKLSYITIPPI